MGMRSTTQAFQFDVPFEQLFQLATPAAQSVPKATVTLADPNRQVVTFDTPMGMMSWGIESNHAPVRVGARQRRLLDSLHGLGCGREQLIERHVELERLRRGTHTHESVSLKISVCAVGAHRSRVDR